MDFDQLLHRFFGTDDLATLSPQQVAAGVDRLRVQFGLERDSGRRFALWCLMFMLGIQPSPDDAFDDPDDRDAARTFMAEAEQAMEDDA